MAEDVDRVIEFAFPGPLRDRLIEAIVAGRKTTTSALLAGYEADEEALPAVGGRGVVVDSAGRPVLVLETTEVRVVPLRDVPLEHAIAEGEGDTSVASWRAGHEQFWASAEVLAELPLGFTVDDSTPIVLERFRVV